MADISTEYVGLFRRRKVVIWRMNPEEAIDIGHAIQAKFPRPDLAWDDGARLIELGSEEELDD